MGGAEYVVNNEVRALLKNIVDFNTNIGCFMIGIKHNTM